MKLKYCLIFSLGVALISCDDPYVTAPDPASDNTSRRNFCYENTDGFLSKCTPDLRPLFSNYVVARGKVYWMTKREYVEHPCLSGMGAFIHNLTSWKCMKSRPNQVHHIEERKLKLVAKFSTEFRAMKGSKNSLTDWQRDQLANYTMDDKAVYFRDKKIEGAAPQSFSVVFPFGSDERWKNFRVSQSENKIFFDWKAHQYIDFSQFHAFVYVLCPGHGLSCTSASQTKQAIKNEERWGILGWIGNDVILLQGHGMTRFPNMASPDMFSFVAGYKTYLFTKNKFYQLNKENDKFIDMDVDYYERYKY